MWNFVVSHYDLNGFHEACGRLRPSEPERAESKIQMHLVKEPASSPTRFTWSVVCRYENDKKTEVTVARIDKRKVPLITVPTPATRIAWPREWLDYMFKTEFKLEVKVLLLDGFKKFPDFLNDSGIIFTEQGIPDPDGWVTWDSSRFCLNRYRENEENPQFSRSGSSDNGPIRRGSKRRGDGAVREHLRETLNQTRSRPYSEPVPPKRRRNVGK